MYNRRSAAKRAIWVLAVLSIVILALTPAGAQVSPPAIVARTGYAAAPALTHTTAAFNSTGSSLLVAFVSSHPTWSSQPVSFSSVTDNVGNTWNLLVGPTSYSGSGGFVLTYPLMSAIYYVNAPTTSATHTLTVNLTNSAPLVVHVFAVSGSDISNAPIYSAITDPGANPTADVTTTDITVQANTLLLAWSKNESGYDAAAQDAWTKDSASANYLAAEYMTAGSAGAYHGHFTYANWDGWQAAIVGVPPAPLTPVAQNLTVTTNYNTPVGTTLSASSPNGPIVSYTIITQPSHGTLSGTAPNKTYTPTTDYYGSDSFTYKASDGTADSNVATVSITVKGPNHAPVASDASVTAAAGTSTPIHLSATDADGDPLTYTVVTGPNHGTLTGTAPNVTYTPTAGYYGADSFTFKANDGQADSNVAMISISVVAVATPPTLLGRVGYAAGPATSHTTNAFNTVGASQLVAFISTNSPWNNLQVGISGVTDSQGNTWNVLTGPTAYGASGTYPMLSAIYYVNSPTTSASHTVTVNLTNSGPLVIHVFAVSGGDTTSAPLYSAIADAGAAASTNAQSADITAPTSTVLLGWSKTETASSPSAQDAWTLDVASNSYLAAEYMTVVTAGAYHSHFLFGAPGAWWQTAIVGIKPMPIGPVALNLTVTTNYNTPVGITLSASSPNGPIVSYTIVSSPTHGTLTGTAPNLTYTPATDYSGSDSFTYKASDGTADSNVASVSITVKGPNHPPVANDNSVTAAANASTPITLTASDADGDTLTYAVVTPPTHGSLSGTAPNLTYTPTTGYYGADSFTFKANDGLADSNVATVSIIVVALATPPTTVGRVGYAAGAQNTHTTTAFNSVGASVMVAFVSTNSPWNSLPVGISGVSDNQGNTWNVLVGPTAYGGTGSYPMLSAIYYVTSPTTSASHTVTVSLSNPGPLVIHVFAVSGSDTTATPVYSPITDAGATGSTNVQSQDITVPASTLLLGWSKNEVGGTATAQDAWTLDVASNSYLYAEYMTATAGAHHSHFLYTAPNGWQTAIVGLKAVPIGPTAQDLTVTTNQNTAVGITLSASSPNGPIVSYTIVSSPTHGTLTGTAPNLTYTPATDYSGGDSFTYKANDGTADSNVATVTITVNAGAVNHAPVAYDQSVTTNSPINITLTATDADNDPLTYAVVAPPAHGSLSGTAPNMTYTPAAGYYGPDSFTFKANDGNVDSNIATVSIKVNAPPVANGQSVTTSQDTAVNITLRATDADNDPLTYAVVTPPAHGSLSGTAPNMTYTPAAGYYGPDSFTFKANDGRADSNIATVSITVNRLNHAPVANNQSVSTNQGTAVNITLTATDADNDPLTYAVATPPAHGSLSGTAPNLTYTSAAGYYGADQFTFKANDGQADSNEATVTITVVAATSTGLTASPNPSTFGQAVLFTATVTSPTGTPTGTVTFQDGTTAIGAGTLNASGQATLSTSALSVGAHPIKATYNGAAGFPSSAPGTLTQTVNKAATSTTLTSAPQPSTYGQAVTFTATVRSAAAGSPTGTVTFKLGTTTLGTGTLNASGQATFVTSALPTGSDVLTATYSGDTSYAGSTSSSYTQKVSKAGTTTAVSGTPNPSVEKQTVTLKAVVRSAGGVPTGTVLFKLGPTKLGKATLDNTGTASLAIATLPLGTSTIKANYSGDSNFSTSTGSMTQTVATRLASTTTVTSSLNPSSFGQLVTFTATVAGTDGVPTGTVTFTLGSITATVTLDANGQASYSTSSLPVGSTTVTATYYNKNLVYAASSGSMVQTVNGLNFPTTTALSTSANPALAKSWITYTPTVTSGGNEVPTGTVTFMLGTSAMGTGTLDATGTASMRTKLRAGTYNVTAVYSGDSTFARSTSATLVQVVQ